MVGNAPSCILGSWVSSWVIRPRTSGKNPKRKDSGFPGGFNLGFEMVNTRFNSVRPAAHVNEPAEESTTRGRDRGREIKENIEVENDEDSGQEEKVQVEATSIPSLDPVLGQQIMSFLKELVGLGVLPVVPIIQTPAKPLLLSLSPRWVEL
uniref:'chromo' domain containing protein n=1 Tax=Solanum tuberosum TaxID=4113 RepID=M1DVT1_SOLTU